MPTARLRFARAAEADLERIEAEGFERFGVHQTVDYIEGLWDVFELIAASPRLAPLRRDLGWPVRIHPWRAHLIVYSEDNNGVTIRRILYGRQDVRAALAQ